MAKEPKLHPIGENIVVRRVDVEEKSAGGIYLPDRAREKPRVGIVVAVGRGRLLPKGGIQEPVVKKGDRVTYGPYVGTEVKVGGEELLIVRESDILAILD